MHFGLAVSAHSAPPHTSSRRALILERRPVGIPASHPERSEGSAFSSPFPSRFQFLVSDFYFLSHLSLPIQFFSTHRHSKSRTKAEKTGPQLKLQENSSKWLLTSYSYV